MSGPSPGAVETADKLVDALKCGMAYSTLRDRIAEALQEKFDLGHKSAGGAQMDKPPAMGGLLEIALDQEEIDALDSNIRWLTAFPESEVEVVGREALSRFLEKISLFTLQRHPSKRES